MRLTDETQILNIDVRKSIIEAIGSPENKRRKDESFKRYMCYKDYTYLYVLKKLGLQFDQDTLTEMQYALSNIAIVKKIVDKLARVYSFGIERKTKDESSQKELDALVETMKVDSVFKKTNRFLKLEKNVIQYIVPVDSVEPAFEGKKEIAAKVLLPHFYDAVEHEDNREKAICYILSDYKASNGISYSPNPARAGRPFGGVTPIKPGDGTDQIIADSPSDQENNSGSYVFWSNKYHFTCNAKGEIISEDIFNPIGKMPIVNYAEDQDNSFWAIGGSDLTDGAVLVNSLITHLIHIAVTQGYGQIVMKGKNLPKSLKVGPNKAILLEYEKDNDPTPEFSFESASPPIDGIRGLIEMYVALLLTTNNLTTSGVSTQLQGASQFPSGIALMIDKAESMEDVKDQQQIFLDAEPKFWDIVASWQRVLSPSSSLVPYQDVGQVPDPKDISYKFGEPQSLETESERLANLKTKFELKIISHLDMIKSEYPDFTDEEAKEKLKEILEKAIEEELPHDESEEDVRNEQQNQQPDRLGDTKDSSSGDEEPDQE